jgi:hypothetical protein
MCLPWQTHLLSSSWWHSGGTKPRAGSCSSTAIPRAAAAAFGKRAAVAVCGCSGYEMGWTGLGCPMCACKSPFQCVLQLSAGQAEWPRTFLAVFCRCWCLSEGRKACAVVLIVTSACTLLLPCVPLLLHAAVAALRGAVWAGAMS